MEMMAPHVANLEVFELRRRYPIETGLSSFLLQRCINITALDTSLVPIDAKEYRMVLPKLPKLRTILIAAHEVLRTFEVLYHLAVYCERIETVGVNCYCTKEDKLMQDALLNLSARGKNLKMVTMQGFHVQKYIENLTDWTRGKELYGNVNFRLQTGEEMPEMRYGIQTAFGKY